MTGKYPKLMVMLYNKDPSYLHTNTTDTVSRGQTHSVLRSIAVQTHTSFSVCSTHRHCPAPAGAVGHCLTMDTTSGTFCTPEGAEGNRDSTTNASNSS